MKVQTIGIDLGKTVLHVVGLDGPGNVVVKKRLSQTQLVRYAANLPSCLVGMEACCGLGGHPKPAIYESAPPCQQGL